MDVKVDLHVVGTKEEPVLRPRKHWLIIVIGQQLVFCCGQRGILGPLLHIGHSGYQLQPAPCWLPATHWLEIMPAWLETQSKYGRLYQDCAELPEMCVPQAQQCARRVACRRGHEDITREGLSPVMLCAIMHKALPERKSCSIVNHRGFPALWKAEIVHQTVPMPISFAKERCLHWVNMSSSLTQAEHDTHRVCM